MDAQLTSLIARVVGDVTSSDDPHAANARHFLTDILLVAFLAVMGGMDDYPGIVEPTPGSQMILPCVHPRCGHDVQSGRILTNIHHW